MRRRVLVVLETGEAVGHTREFHTDTGKQIDDAPRGGFEVSQQLAVVRRMP